ncbi:MAG: hypothetical protein V1859_00480 [archaeon]
MLTLSELIEQAEPLFEQAEQAIDQDNSRAIILYHQAIMKLDSAFSGDEIIPDLKINGKYFLDLYRNINVSASNFFNKTGNYSAYERFLGDAIKSFSQGASKFGEAIINPCLNRLIICSFN